ncbi:DEAD/DEAH box helicase [Glaciecola siphonariae]|uniref:DEAD/DEAH box helicase n=1 Tax=Glaciecola siphonariae TaxID=521012 RepID=A0ABV9LSN5_9ALTE
MQFTDLALDNRLLTALSTMQLSDVTDIQQQAIPHGLMGKDLLASSKTGSGKTLAFLVPVVNRLLTQKALSKRDARALILAPTRELAKQVFSVAKTLTQKMSLQCTLIVGGENYNDQAKALRRNPQIVVGTAGRISDHLAARHLFLNGLELLVLDEADRMLELGFEKALENIHSSADHRKRQTMMFSATIDSAEVNYVTQLMLKTPVKINIDKVATPHEDISQAFYFADGVTHKNKLLLKAIDIEGREQALVFTATREDTERLAKQLKESDISAAFLHGDLLQNQRSAIINDFGRGKIGVLVTTDLASRGLDIANIAKVINYDLPRFADEYVHRIGRTGRAGKKGAAVSFVSRKDWRSFLAIQSRLERRFEFTEIEGLVAKFKGLGTKPKSEQKNVVEPRTKTKPTAAKPKATKRFNPLESSEDMGFAPVKRKPRAAPEDDIDSTEED